METAGTVSCTALHGCNLASARDQAKDVRGSEAPVKECRGSVQHQAQAQDLTAIQGASEVRAPRHRTAPQSSAYAVWHSPVCPCAQSMTAHSTADLVCNLPAWHRHCPSRVCQHDLGLGCRNRQCDSNSPTCMLDVSCSYRPSMDGAVTSHCMVTGR